MNVRMRSQDLLDERRSGSRHSDDEDRPITCVSRTWKGAKLFRREICNRLVDVTFQTRAVEACPAKCIGLLKVCKGLIMACLLVQQPGRNEMKRCGLAMESRRPGEDALDQLQRL